MANNILKSISPKGFRLEAVLDAQGRNETHYIVRAPNGVIVEGKFDSVDACAEKIKQLDAAAK